ncbi:MAG: YhjD/YihY/BrkB family envelope integrity protein [Planctomycetota bacterium]|jgi:membrane protein
MSMFSSIRSSLRRGFEWTRTALTDPIGQLSRWQRSIRQAYRIGRYSLRHLGEDRASQMAATLSFRLLFGLLPVLVVATVAAKAVLGPDLPEIADRLVHATGMDGVELALPDGGDGELRSVSLGEWVEDLVTYAAGINLSALGWIGFGVVAFSAIWVLVTVETCFNEICRAPRSRSWWARIPIYWFALTVGPLVLAVIPIVNSGIADTLRNVSSWGPWTTVGAGTIDFVLLWAFWFGAYLWVPNTRMDVRPVLIGAFVTAVLLMIGRSFLGLYMRNAFALSGLYGSLGLVPVFMFWIYLMSMFSLLGLQVASLLQTLRHRTLEDLEAESGRTEFIEPAQIVTLMEHIATRFTTSEATSAGEASGALALPEPVVSRMLEALADRGWLHRVEGGAFALAVPPDRIDAAEVVDVGFALADRGLGSGWLEQIRLAQRRLLEGVSLDRLAPSTAREA